MSMDTNFDDDFDGLPGIQPSGPIHLDNAPDLSQEAWYDIEDDEVLVDEDAIPVSQARQTAGKAASQYPSPQPPPGSQKTSHSASARPNSWSIPSFFQAGQQKKAKTAPPWKKLLTFRALL